MPHARPPALAAEAGGDQQRLGGRSPPRGPGVAERFAPRGVSVHQHRPGSGLRHLCGPAYPTGHLDRALPGSVSAAGQGAVGLRAELKTLMGGECVCSFNSE